MCITKAQILEWRKTILEINSIESEEERQKYLNGSVEDVDLFLETLRAVKKERLRVVKRKPSDKAVSVPIYDKDEVLNLFQNNTLEDILQRYSKVQLSAMHQAVFSAKPLSADKKERIAQKIMGHVHSASRAKALLED